MKWGGVPVILTNSHCTEKNWESDSHQRFLSQPNLPLYQIGPEYFDRTGRYCGVLDLAKCRRADVALYSLSNVDMLPGESSSYAHGEIARPVSMRPGVEQGLSARDIDSANPLRVVGVREFPIAGEILHRIGQYSGWQYGPVTQTCTDRVMDWRWFFGWVGQRILQCQSTASTNSQGGDSGGPVFVYLGGRDVLFAGLNWGNDEQFDEYGNVTSGVNANGHFSSIQQIRSELYQHEFTFYQFEVPPPQFEATIVGPAFITQFVTGTWTASAANGTEPYLYSWEVDGAPSGAGQSLDWMFSVPFTTHAIVVRVEDATGRVATKQFDVNVDDGQCPPNTPGCAVELRAPAGATPPVSVRAKKRPNPAHAALGRHVEGVTNVRARTP